MLDTDNHIFQLAVQFINQTNRHIFLTGKAGTGKTTFLKYIHDNTVKKMVVVAPTGVAAINAGGVTMHSFFQLPFGMFLPVHGRGWNSQTSQVNNIQTLLHNLRLNKEKRELMHEMELLVIDEVSMVRADMLDAVDHVMRHVRKQPSLPFGGVQVLYIGDLFQLPPVVKDDERVLLLEHYKSPFFFDAKVMEQSQPLYLELKKIYRQSDAEFIDILNNVRNNEVTPSDLTKLHTFYKPSFQPSQEENYITLTSHNAKADSINSKELSLLNGETFKFEAVITGDFNDRSYPAEKVLDLKEGAQIMFIKNDKGEVRRYYNGKIGKIKSIDEEKIIVTFPDGSADIDVEKETWKNIRYNFNADNDSIEEEELGEFKQYPIRLAWAITIHKSQGLTFTKAIIDAGASFAPGQVYVALSRLTDMSGLVLLSRIQPGSITSDERVLDFCENEKELDELGEQLKDDRKKYVNTLLLKTFDWVKIVDYLQQNYNEFAGRLIADNSAEMLSKEWADLGEEQQKVAIKFVLQLDQLLLQAETEGYEKLQQRVEAAATYFNKTLGELLTAVEKQIDQLRVKKRVTKYIGLLKKLRAVLSRKVELIKTASQIAEGLAKGTDLTGLLDYVNTKPVIREQETEPEAKPSSTKQPKGTSHKISLELFKAGKAIEDIAQERGMAIGTIESHLTSFIPTGEVTIGELVSAEKLTAILAVIKEVGETAATPIKEKLGSEFTYGEIRAVATHLRSQKENTSTN